MSRKKLKDNIKKLIKQHLNEAHRVWHTPGYDDKYFYELLENKD